MKETFEARLPWFVNGTLDAEAAAEMKRVIAADADTAAELRAYREFSEVLRNEWQPLPQEVPDFARLRTRIASERRVRSGPSRPWWRRFAGWLAGSATVPRLAGVAALLVVAVQATVLAVLYGDLAVLEERASLYRSSAGATDVGPFIRVSFRAEAREMDTRMLLIGIGASYVGGPSQLGEYYVFVGRDQADQAIRILRASHLVDSVELVAKVPRLN
jgi:hypothetical protein